MQLQTLCAILAGTTVAALLALVWCWRALQRARKSHAAHELRLAWAEWWAKNACEFPSDPVTSRLLDQFALCALKATTLRQLARALMELALPEGWTVEQMAKLAEQTTQPEALQAFELMARARGALAELKLGVPQFEARPEGIFWTLRGHYTRERAAGGVWVLALLERGVGSTLSGTKQFVVSALSAAKLTQKTE